MLEGQVFKKSFTRISFLLCLDFTARNYYHNTFFSKLEKTIWSQNVHADHGLDVERQSLEYSVKKKQQQATRTQIRRET